MRGGHIELVTPKFQPTADETRKIYDVFASNNLVPDVKAGGAHINFDLKAFEGNPKALARFLARFLENRGTIAMAFQDIHRLSSAEPVQVPEDFVKKLRDFNGSEEDLKKLLYDSKYFNTRLGRKTKYNQIDLSAYFQDVIPQELLTKDFDIKNDPWRQTFNVDPKIRKGEARFMNAARNADEAALQLKFMRALMHDAFYGTTPIKGNVQKVDYNGMVQDPKKTLAEFETLLDELQLPRGEYRGFILEGMNRSRRALASKGFVPFEEKMKPFPPQGAWGQATAARPKELAISSEMHDWTGTPSRAATNLVEENRSIRQHAEELRKKEDAPLLNSLNNGDRSKCETFFDRFAP